MHSSFCNSRSASSSHTVSHQSLLIAAHICSTFSSVPLVAGLPECGPLSRDSWSSLKHLCHTFICSALIASSPKTFWIIQIVYAEECSSLTQNLMEILCSTHSVILNVMATEYTYSLTGVYCYHWLVQWRHHCSWVRIPVQSPWLLGYITVVQTVLVILTMARLSPDSPNTIDHVNISKYTLTAKESFKNTYL